jgi:hypothetical protein
VAQRTQEEPQRLPVLVVDEREPQRPCGALLPRGRRARSRADDVVAGRERAFHQLARRGERRRPRVEAAEEALDEPPRHLRGDDALGRRVERPDVERAGVAQRQRGGARRERLVDVHEVERRPAQHVVERAPDVQRRGRRHAAPRRRERQQLADGEHAHAAAGVEELAGPDQPARLAHQLRGAGRRENDHPVPAPGQLGRQRAHERVDLVLVLPRMGRDLRDGEAVAHHRAGYGAGLGGHGG